jgi:hypothetical protein
MEIMNLLVFLVKLFTLRMKIVKCECTSACNSSHFNNFIDNNWSNGNHKCSFLWTSICYKILCDIIYSLACKGGGGVMVFSHPVLAKRICDLFERYHLNKNIDSYLEKTYKKRGKKILSKRTMSYKYTCLFFLIAKNGKERQNCIGQLDEKNVRETHSCMSISSPCV